jgi:predicted MFS family arabinose efflux permease
MDLVKRHSANSVHAYRPTLMCVIMLFTFGNLLCGFAQNAIWLFIARAISGVGGGGINSMCMIIVGAFPDSRVLWRCELIRPVT